MNIYLLIGMCAIGIIIGVVVGYDKGCKDCQLLIKEDFDNVLNEYEKMNTEWGKAYNEINEDWKSKFIVTTENYERQIKVLKQMLDKERGEK